MDGAAAPQPLLRAITAPPREPAEANPQPAEASPQPAEVSELEPPGAPSGCRPSGEAPSGYQANALEVEGRIELGGAWRLGEQVGSRGRRPDLDDSAWSAVEVPGVWRPDALPGKRTPYWLRRRFTLPPGLDRDRLALDLGGRVGRSEVWLNGTRIKKMEPTRDASAPFFAPGPLPLVEGENVLAVQVIATQTTGGVLWYGDAALGTPTTRRRGLVYHQFTSEVDGTRQQLAVYVPRCADLSRPLPLLVALPGWNGNPHVFGASRLLEEAERRDLLVLVPDPRGNVLYTDKSERGVLEAVAVVSRDFSVDPDRVGLTGTSMGGAGALQIGYHYPDRFAAVSSFYGDSTYELTTYAGKILKQQSVADRYSVLRFAANARNLPVLLIHAEDDPVTPVRQSRALFEASQRLGFDHHALHTPPEGGHTLKLVDDFAAEVVAFHASARRARRPERVSFRANARAYPGSHWLEVELRAEPRFGGADMSYRDGVLTVHAIGRGLQAARVSAPDLELEALEALEVDVQAPLGAPLWLVGLKRAEAVGVERLDGASEPVVVEVDGGELRLGELAPGRWRVRWR
ncbi:MAG: hypothetical protein CMH57_05695 [Myxococcales bacterium]|nr:hypothetical protein [Myxococcales bacterium]